MIKERGHAQTSILKTRTSVKSCALVKITGGQVGHSILTSGPNLARGGDLSTPGLYSLQKFVLAIMAL